MNKDKIIDHFNLKNFGTKGWKGSSSLVCYECGRPDKSGIMFVGDGAIFSCMRCAIKTNINTYLKKSGLNDLIEKSTFQVTEKRTIKPLNEEIENSAEIELKEIRLPIGFRKIDSDTYLESRNFSPYHYKLFEPGVTKLDPKRKHHIIYKMFNDEDKLVAYISRSRMNKDFHKKNIEEYKKGNEELVLRYDNSTGVDFGSILGGFRDMNDKVHTIILVEGLYDKVNVDNLVGLDSYSDTRCFFTFGDAIKKNQINLIKKYKNVKKVFLLYDSGTIANCKRFGIELQRELKGVDVFVCEIKGDKDPGELNVYELFDVIGESVNVIEFVKTKLNHGIRKEKK